MLLGNNHLGNIITIKILFASAKPSQLPTAKVNPEGWAVKLPDITLGTTMLEKILSTNVLELVVTLLRINRYLLRIKIIIIEFINVHIWMFIDTSNNNIWLLRITNLNKCRF